MGKKRTKIMGAEGFGELSIEDLVKGPKKKKEEKKVEKQSYKESKKPEIPDVIAIPTLRREKQSQPEVDRPIISSDGAAKSAVEATKEEAKKVVAKRKKIERKKTRGKAYKEALSKIDRKNTYKLEEAIELLKKISYTKFDPTVELHVHTISKKGQEPIRFTLVLTAGTVKLSKVRIIDEVALQDVEAGKIDFEIAIATPAMMPKLAKFAKILGPRGLMPNPKAGTVTDDPQKVMEQFQKGQIEVRSDSLGNIHVGLAKLSWETPRITENVKAILSHVPVNRIGSVTLASTMSPGLKIAV